MRNPFIATIALHVLASAASAGESAEARQSVSFDATYTAETWRLAGDEFVYLDNLDLSAMVDGETLLGIPGLQIFAYALYDNGHAVNEGVVDTIQGLSNIEAVRAFRMYEAWAQWHLAPSTSIRAGLYDLNSEFDSIDAAGVFINPSHGIGPDFSQSGMNGPSIFPSTSIAVRMQAEVGGWSARVAVLDAVPGDPDHPDNTTVRWDSSEGLLYVAEVDYSIETGGRTGMGYWHYGDRFDDLFASDENGEPVSRANNRGAYAFAETSGISLKGHGEVTIFTRTGWANDRVNPVSHYVGAGVVWSGFAGERNDQLGFSIAHVGMGDAWRRAMRDEGERTRSSETILELTGQFAVGEYLTLQPDVQYVHRPGALDDRAALWLFGLRLAVGWSAAH